MDPLAIAAISLGSVCTFFCCVCCSIKECNENDCISPRVAPARGQNRGGNSSISAAAVSGTSTAEAEAAEAAEAAEVAPPYSPQGQFGPPAYGSPSVSEGRSTPPPAYNNIITCQPSRQQQEDNRLDGISWTVDDSSREPIASSPTPTCGRS